MATISENLQAVHAAMGVAAVSAGRTVSEIKLLAVSKTFPVSALRCAFEAGQTIFAESYVQEALGKIAALQDLPIEWHFIGPIQSNKTREIAKNFAWVHGVDRLKIAERLSAQRPLHLPPLNVCIQINTSQEASKSGVSPEEAAGLAQAIAALPRLRLRGLMTVPAPSGELLAQRTSFATLRVLRDELNRQGLQLDTLSMGMSHDFVAAILEGATLIRVGSAIFGNRIYNQE